VKGTLSQIFTKIFSKSNSSQQISKTDYHATYSLHLQTLKANHSYDRAMKLAVGGEFEAAGILERQALIHFGLKKGDYLIDIGCGSGRLALPLSEYLTGRYLGIDIMPELVEYARKLVARPDWRFEVAEGLSIPEKGNSADVVCFFSVFTHLLHEQSYIYLQEAKRVLKPGGMIVFSFLDFTLPQHWNVFEANLREVNMGTHLNMFMSKDAIPVWAERLNLKVQHIQDGDKGYIPLPTPIKLESGDIMSGLGTMGQSVCVLKTE
jgi:ubiquinone/menaquinone biosynthesis C-methylase UbiE